MLDRLAAERRLGRRQNLVVAATRTGKTVVAAFDYLRLEEEGAAPQTLIAHRSQILTQALTTFRQVLRDPAFGEILDGDNKPSFSAFCDGQSRPRSSPGAAVRAQLLADRHRRRGASLARCDL